MTAKRTLSRRHLFGTGIALTLAVQPAFAGVRVVRGSRSESSSGGSDQKSGGGVRVVRPNGGARLPEGDSLSEMLAGSAERDLVLQHAHTGENLTIAYWRDGALDPDARTRLLWFLRDWRQSRPSPLSTSLLNTLWAVQRRLAEQEHAPALRVLSAYRTKATNDALAAAGVAGVARDSFHLRGMAVDVHCPDRGHKALERACLDIVPGGLGLYRRAGFVHIDSGPGRRWVG